MGLHLGDTFPNFACTAFHRDVRRFDLYDYMGESWLLFFSHPDDFTPVCTTELGKASDLNSRFSSVNCKLLALSCNSTESHAAWSADIMKYTSSDKAYLPFPIVADPDRSIATKLGIMDAEEKDKQGLPLTCRSAFFIGPDKKLKASVLYPATTGRSIEELYRVLVSLQLTASLPVATPEGWNMQDPCVISPTLPNESANKLFPGFKSVPLPSGKNYLRYTPDCPKLDVAGSELVNKDN